jgi:hypothetical protein
VKIGTTIATKACHLRVDNPASAIELGHTQERLAVTQRRKREADFDPEKQAKIGLGGGRPVPDLHSGQNNL